MERIKITLGKTFNLGNYESKRIEVGIERDVEQVTKENTTRLREQVYKLLKQTAENVEI